MNTFPENASMSNWINTNDMNNRNNAGTAANAAGNTQQYALPLQLSQSAVDLFDPAGGLFAAVSSQSNIYNTQPANIHMASNHAAFTASNNTPNANAGAAAAAAAAATATTTASAASAINKPKKRFRRTQACDDCRRRKVRCDGNRPSCTSCLRHGVACHYQETLKKRGPKPGYIEKLERRLNLMEKMLMPLSVPTENGSGQTQYSQNKMFNSSAAEKLMRELAEDSIDMQGLSNQMDWFSQLSDTGNANSPTTATTPAPASTSASASTSTPVIATATTTAPSSTASQPAKNELAIKPMNTSSVAQSICTLASIMSEENDNNTVDSLMGKHGSPPPLPRFNVNVAGELTNVLVDAPDMADANNSVVNNLPVDTSSILAMNTPDTTSPQLRDHLIENVFTYAYYSTPFLHRATFIRQTRDNTVPRMLLYAVMALGVRFSPLPEVRNDPSLRNGMVYVHRAKNLLKQTVAIPDVTSIATLSILGSYMYACGDMAKSWIAAGASLRMAQGLGLHVLDDETDDACCIDSGMKDDWIGREMRRRLWWSLVLTDRFAGVASGRPMAVDEDDCEVKPACDDALWHQDTLGDGVPLTGEPVGDIGHLTAWTSRPSYMGMQTWMRLALLTGRVARYVNRPRQRGPNGMYTGPPDDRFVRLEKELMEFGKDTANILEAVGLTDDPTWPPTNVRRSGNIEKFVARDEMVRYTIRMVYHVAQLYLYRSILSSKFNTGCYEAHTPYTISYLRRAQTAADSILAICARLRPEHYAYSIPPFIFGVAASCLMQLHTAVSGDLGPAAVTAAQQKLATALYVLSQTENYWAIAGLHRGMLTELCHMMDERTSSRRADTPISTDNTNSNTNNSNDSDQNNVWKNVRLPIKTSMRELIPLWERAVQRELAALFAGQQRSNNLGLLQPFNAAMEMNDLSGSSASNGSESPEIRSLTNTPTFKDDDDLSSFTDTPYSPATATSSSFSMGHNHFSSPVNSHNMMNNSASTTPATSMADMFPSPIMQSEHGNSISVDYSQILQSATSFTGLPSFPRQN
ncbi:fungal-specific transcription factor domain-containing protein [Syncephalis fuscata]|nr:fungal-specific transcription factor domain-containing protein [Syncephalis fuscata]